MTAFNFDENLFSDLHKDVYGFRPRNHEFYEASDERKEEIWNQTMAALEFEIELEKLHAETMANTFRARIQETIELGAGDEETALRWILEGENFSLNDYQYGADYAAYHFGFDYANEWRDLLDKVCHQKVKQLWNEAA